MLFPLLQVMHRPQSTFPRRLRRAASTLSQIERDQIISWIKSQPLPLKQLPCIDYVSPSRLEALCCTLPTRDGSITSPMHRSPVTVSEVGSHLSPGHHLIFCNPAVAERYLSPDATSNLLSPPAPLTRRMWAGGKIEIKRPVRVGDVIAAEIYVSKLESKRLDSENPMVVTEQTIETKIVDRGLQSSSHLDSGCITEVRSHVYLPVNNKHRIRIVDGLPRPKFSFSYTPTDTMLFRFSALTFNAHKIHLDKEYAQNVEQLPGAMLESNRMTIFNQRCIERLVHGPMTALMLLEAAELYKPQHSAVHKFDYRATNPLFVNRRITIHGGWLSKDKLKVWAQDDDGVVGMMGEVQLNI